MEYDGATDWIGETFVSDAGWSHLERLVNIGNRMAGSEGERRAAEATRDALAEHARNARIDEFDVQGWERGTSAVETDRTTDRKSTRLNSSHITRSRMPSSA